MSDKIIKTEDIAETVEFVIVKFTEIIGGEKRVSYEKGIKDSLGDIVAFERI